jgi:molybdate transport system permease protein
MPDPCHKVEPRIERERGMNSAADSPLTPPTRHGRDWPFHSGLIILSGSYVVLILAMLAADLSFTTPNHLQHALASPAIQYSIKLSLISCTLSTMLSLWIAVPAGYLMSRFNFPGKRFLDSILDIPIVLPPLVIGLSLLILFQTPLCRAFQKVVPVTYAIPSVILAQFSVACAFALRTMLVTFDQISPRCERVALTLGCNRSQAFWLVALPEARRGMLTAATLAWARALGEFGPILVFSGATRMRTEVLSTSVFLELSIGNIEAAVAVSLIMIIAALLVLTVARAFGLRVPLERVL